MYVHALKPEVGVVGNKVVVAVVVVVVIVVAVVVAVAAEVLAADVHPMLFALRVTIRPVGRIRVTSRSSEEEL